MRLHVLTACSRPGLLPAVASSIANADTAPWEVCWHVRFDLDRRHVGGQHLKNQMLDQIMDGWVCFLDDDTVMHPRFPGTVAEAVANGADALIVTQSRADGRVLTAHPDNVHVGLIDIGQACVRRATIGRHRIPLDYNGDGMFLEAVCAGQKVAFVDETLSYHNMLEEVAA